ncbi:YycH family regulatory protein [Paenibacillus senegalensis]|uniref:YycH family regulatory protein n=1 Tax=Paenibacillus senegalensis TaxID=1465766 RepID=UPI0002886FAB|nr:two-component system activity regulator YycH [Paenibacillus senegalensis]
MMETFKSIALVVLVAASLVQSYLLAFSSPNYDPMSQIEYVETGWDGPQLAMGELMAPDQMVIHFGNERHTVLAIGHQFYNMIYYDFVTKRSFDQLRRVNLSSSDLNWVEIRNQRPGIELRFQEAVPLGLLTNTIQIRDDTVPEDEYISRIWLFLDPNGEDVQAYFFPGTSGMVWHAGSTDITVRELENRIRLGTHLPSYSTENGQLYLPDVDLELPAAEISYSMINQEQIKRSLFPDPGMVRYLFERDGAQIYTDGKRGLQMEEQRHWFVYSDPVSSPQSETQPEVIENLQNAVKFVNRHGGWNGDYLLSQVSPRYSTGQQTIIFRQYWGQYPILTNEQGVPSFGHIRVSMERGIVSGFERSLLNLDLDSAEKTMAVLTGGEALQERVKQSGFSPVSVVPAYEAEIHEEAIQLVPRWAMKLSDGSYRFLP